MRTELQIPKKKYILHFSLTGSLLTTIIPITVALDHLREGQFLLRLIDISTLFSLTVIIFYISFWMNLRLYKSEKFRLVSLNIFVLLAVCLVSILIHAPIWKMISHIPMIFYIRDEFVRNTTIFIVSYLAAKYYYNYIENQHIKLVNTELKNENLTNQVNGLMQQINPHFFFNTLNTLSGLVQESPEKSEIFINKLSQVFRYVLKMQENSKVLLQDELRFAADYFYLLKMRFEDKINLTVNVQPMRNEMVAPLCTQLLIENVIKHNRMNRQTPVNIDIGIEDEYLSVCNSFFPQQSSISMGLGLKNLNKRCELLSGRSIIIERTESMFCVKVPLMKNESYESNNH
jgi:two-component system LytT family sensor kinase